MIDTLETLLYCLILMTIWLGISFVMGVIIGKAMHIGSCDEDDK